MIGLDGSEIESDVVKNVVGGGYKHHVTEAVLILLRMSEPSGKSHLMWDVESTLSAPLMKTLKISSPNPDVT